jgi:hypothetical protein
VSATYSGCKVKDVGCGLRNRRSSRTPFSACPRPRQEVRSRFGEAEPELDWPGSSQRRRRFSTPERPAGGSMIHMRRFREAAVERRDIRTPHSLLAYCVFLFLFIPANVELGGF